MPKPDDDMSEKESFICFPGREGGWPEEAETQPKATRTQRPRAADMMETLGLIWPGRLRREERERERDVTRRQKQLASRQVGEEEATEGSLEQQQQQQQSALHPSSRRITTDNRTEHLESKTKVRRVAVGVGIG